MLPRPLCISLVIAVCGGAAGCGETSSNPAGAGAAQGGETAGPRYAGAVLAMATEQDGAMTYAARAVFKSGPRPAVGGCPRCCCGSTERGLPIPAKPPDAREITLLPAGGSTALATLVPEPFEDVHGTLHGMSDLGWSWFAPLSDYAPVTSQPWSADDILEVLAQGNEIEPFSGMLRAGPALVGVTPPIGSSPLVLHQAQPFEISWTPAGNGDATVLLGIPNADGMCYCDAPDSAGTLLVSAALLSPAAGEISLARLSISNVANGNASIDLVGAVVQTGPVEVR